MKNELYPHQKTGAAFLAERGFAFLWDDMGCVDGEAVVYVNRAGLGKKMTLATLFKRWQTWDHSRPTRMRALCNGELRQHEIVDVLDKGIQPVVKITLQSGKMIRVTPDHEMALPNDSWLSAETLVSGSIVLINGMAVCATCGSTEAVVTNKYMKFPGHCRTCIYRYRRSNKWNGSGKHLDKYGYVLVSAQWDHPRCDHHGTVREHILVMEKALSRYIEPHEHVNHINENKSDNTLSNLEVLTQSEHHRRHHRHLNLHGGIGGKGGDVTFFPKEDIVVSVESDGEAHVYDVVMEGEYRNFVANGFIVHNCGKSATVIRACDLVGAQKILVLCPAVVRRHWEAEFETWAQPRSQQQIERPINCIEGFVKESPGAGVTIVSHDCLADVAPPPRSKAVRRDAYSYPLLRDADYDAIIFDESHAGRDINAARAKNFWMPGELWERARHVWALTGTPIVNSAADLWLPAFGPMRTSVSWFDWCSQYAEMKPDGYNGLKPVGLKNAPELADFLRPHALRRTLDSIGIELPTLTVRDVPLVLPQSALTAAMAGLERWTPAMLQRALESGSELKDAALARVRHALGLIKAVPAAAHVEAILKSGDGPVVVFFQHTAVREIMWKHLFDAGYRTSWIDGKVTRNQLRAAKEWFQAGRLDVLLVQMQSGSQGISLTRAHRTVIVELPWTAVAVQQAVKRMHRIGQKQACLAEILRVQDCWLEDALASVVTKKERAADALLSLLVSYQ